MTALKDLLAKEAGGIKLPLSLDQICLLNLVDGCQDPDYVIIKNIAQAFRIDLYRVMIAYIYTQIPIWCFLYGKGDIGVTRIVKNVGRSRSRESKVKLTSAINFVEANRNTLNPANAPTDWNEWRKWCKQWPLLGPYFSIKLLDIQAIWFDNPVKMPNDPYDFFVLCRDGPLVGMLVIAGYDVADVPKLRRDVGFFREVWSVVMNRLAEYASVKMNGQTIGFPEWETLFCITERVNYDERNRDYRYALHGQVNIVTETHGHTRAKC